MMFTQMFIAGVLGGEIGLIFIFYVFDVFEFHTLSR